MTGAPAYAVTDICLRRIRPADAMGLVEFHGRLSPRTRYLRFFFAKQQVSPDEARWFADVDFEHRVAFVATTEESTVERIIAVARFDRIDSDRAEFALVVRDDHQRLGIGTALFSCLVIAARCRGIDQLIGLVIPDNTAMLQFAAHVGALRGHDPRYGPIVIASTEKKGGYGRPWQEPRPESRKVLPAWGMNSHS